MGFYVGIDWGGTRHAVCVVDEADGTIAARFEVAHTAAGLAELERRLAKFGPPSSNRGRDAHYWAPPAQNRTCGIPAYGSHLG